MRVSLRSSLAVTALTVTLLALSGCGSETGNATTDADATSSGSALSEVQITVVTPYLANAATKESIDLFTEQAEGRGWQVNTVDTAGDMNRLNSALQDAAAQSPDAIVLGSGDPTQMSLGLQAAAEADIPVFAIDSGAADGIAANVTSDNTDLGRRSAEALVNFMGGSGAVVMLSHDPHPGLRERAAGARAVFEEANIEVLDEVHVEVPGPVDNARSTMQDILSARGDQVDGVWGGWDEPALGATQAMQAAGVDDVPVVGVDGQDFALAAIEEGGPFKATVAQDWRGITGQVVELIADLLQNGTHPAQDQYELPGELITGEG